MKRLIIISIVTLILCGLFVTAQQEETTVVVRQLNERLERNKAEILKEIQDSEKRNMETINQSIDSNFAVLDDRLQNFFKDSQRTIAVIVVAGYVTAFTLSQIIKIKIEQMRRKSLVEKSIQLEDKVNSLTKDAQKLTKMVKKLKDMEQKYSDKLEAMKPRRFFNVKNILLAIGTFIMGAVITFFLVGGINA